MENILITGITGQDGAYLAEYLLNKGHKVFGLYRRSSTLDFWRLKYLGIQDHLNLTLIEFDLNDLSSIYRAIELSKPRIIFNLAAQSFVTDSFNTPLTTANITGIGPLNFLEAIRNIDKTIKFYQASTSEMFVLVQEIPQKETTPFYPRSPYAVAKLYAHWICKNYRESYGIYAVSGILFNHESPLRGEEFVTRKITSSIAKIKHGIIESFELGNIYSKRDWGYAKDYVEGMYLMMLQNNPDDYILSTNKTYTIKEFVDFSFQHANIEIDWIGDGINEKAVHHKTGKTLLNINQKYYRPAEVDILIGDYTKAFEELNWRPKTDVYQLSKIMIESDLMKFKNG